MKRHAVLVLTVLFLSCTEKNISADQVIFDRIDYIYHLKSMVEEKIWKGVDDEKFDLPLIYYTDSVCYVANPTDKFLAIFKAERVYDNGMITIYKTRSLVDNIPFHMETAIRFGDSTHYAYQSPFMNCSSYELTKKTIADITGSEEWAVMVIHEYFHGYQFKHAAYADYLSHKVALITRDSVARIYEQYPWFKESVDQENSLLLDAIAADSDPETSKLVDAFFALREKRIKRVKEELRVDLETIEEIYETMEGTARYVEYGLFKEFVTKVGDQRLTKSDTSYHAYRGFRNFGPKESKRFYKADAYYFYATGFNMVRLLNKHKIDYKQRLFNERDLSLAQLLKTMR